MSYRFDEFGLSEMVQAASELRGAAEHAPDFDRAASAIVARLHSAFVAEDGRPALSLVRLFSTRRWSGLSPDLRAAGRAALAADEERDALRCLVLEATAGVEPAWNDPAASRGHRVIPLPSAQAIRDAPMISALVEELGLAPAAVVEGQDLTQTSQFGTFHVPAARGSGRIPDQVFVSRYGIESALGFGGVLSDGEVYAVVMFSRVPIDARAAEQFRALAVGVRAGLLVHSHAPTGTADVGQQRRALREHLQLLEQVVARQAADLQQAVERMRVEAELVGMLQSVGRRLMAQLDLDSLVQDATETATKVTGAAFGAFFYNVVNDLGEAYTLYTIAGAPREAFSRFPMPRNTAVFAPTFTGETVVRSDDITADPRYGQNEPYRGMPPGHLPVRSYLAVPVVSTTSREVLGGFFFGHPQPGQFTSRHEQLAEGIAGYAAIALDNARLYARQRTMAAELQRSMLPTVPTIDGFEVESRYLPAATGSDVGGDWLDVIELPAGRTAFIVGDVMGRGIPAATVMGQIRTAVRSYALLDLPPAEIMQHVSELALGLPGHQFITCVYAVHDPAEATLTYANAGHLPPLVITPDGHIDALEERLGLPLRVGAAFRERQIDFPPGSGLVLYTDGLVERRDRPLPDGIVALREALLRVRNAAAGEAGVACDKLIHELTEGRYEDDVALLYVRDLDLHRRSVVLPLTAGPDAAAQVRRQVRAALAAWGLDAAADTVLTIATELVANAVRHAHAPVRLRLHQAGDRLVIDVIDRDQRLPRRMEPALEDRQHRGLFLVNAFARRWGTRPLPDGKVVWAEVDVRAPGRSRR